MDEALLNSTGDQSKEQQNGTITNHHPSRKNGPTNEPERHRLTESNEKDAKEDTEPGKEQVETRCGLGSWRPPYLNCFANIWTFTVVLSLITIFGNMNFTYYTAVITQIERGFGLSSSFTGFLKNVDNIGFMITVIIVSHFLRSANKPKVFSFATTLSAVAIFLFAVPHFLYGAPQLSINTDLSPSGNQTSKASKFELCSPGSESDEEDCSDPRFSIGLGAGALFFFILSEILQGMAQAPSWTLSMTYLDDNAKENKTPLHFGILFGTRAVSPVLGFLMGAWTTQIFVDLSDPGIDEKDPRWVGAWWIGFIICAACTVVWALPLALFPPSFANSPAQETNYMTLEGKSLKGKIKELLLSTKRLFRNMTFVCIVLGGCFNMSLIGFSTFIPKYIESFYGQTASQANIYTGIVSAFAWGIGPIVSGTIMSRLKLSQVQILRFVVAIHIATITGYSTIMLLQCPSSEWAGTISFSGIDVSTSCNSNCSCDLSAYNPVCGSDGFNYYSPCYAGCTVKFNATDPEKVFSGCGCIDDGMATLGLCERSCFSFYVYLVLLFFLQLLGSMMIVPLFTIMLHCVDPNDKALALGISAFITQLAGFPAPMMFGAVIDSTCLVYQTSCHGKGACLLYDHNDFKFKLHGLPVGLKSAALICFSISLLQTTRQNKQDNKNNDWVVSERELVGAKESVLI